MDGDAGMKIERHTKESSNFYDLEIGTVFIWDKEFYLKILAREFNEANALDLQTYIVTHFSRDIKVEKTDSTLVIK